MKQETVDIHEHQTRLRSRVQNTDCNLSTTSTKRPSVADEVSTEESCVYESKAGSSQPSAAQVPDSSSWKGWAELENDPLIFSTLLYEWGVKRIKVQEVVPLDVLFEKPADTVYGLVFLSRWAASNMASNPADETQPNIWFANQISTFSCATIALMNIINNHPEVDLGPELKQFQEITQNLPPLERGLALDQFEHVGRVHNSFSTELDRLMVDLDLKREAQAAKRAAAKPRAKKRRRKPAFGQSKKSKSREKEDSDVDDDVDDDGEDTSKNGLHFIAYVPSHGRVWKMDGLEPTPHCLGKLEMEDNWLAIVLVDLQTQMETAKANHLEFSLLSVESAQTPVVTGGYQDGQRNNDTVGDDTRSADERERMRRVREDWAPFIEHMIRLHAEKGDLGDMLPKK